LSLIYSVVLRLLFRGPVPLHGFTAPHKRSGKSQLANTAIRIATGQSPKAVGMRDAAETDKRMATHIAARDRAITIDNQREDAPLGNADLARYLSEENPSARRLGENEQISGRVPVMAATGNNLSFTSDVGSRAILCAIDAGADPGARAEWTIEREHGVTLTGFVAAQQPELLAAALTIYQGWCAAGRPTQKLPAMGGFEGWSQVVRQLCVWGFGTDPYARVADESEAYDSDVLSALVRCIPVGTEFTAKGVLGYARGTLKSPGDITKQFSADEDGELLTFAINAMRGRDNALSPAAIGRVLSSIVDRPIGPHVLRRISSAAGGSNAAYRIELVRAPA
jgi:hypothetical protein